MASTSPWENIISALPLERLRFMTEESGSKEATELCQKKRQLGTSKLVNEIFDDTPRDVYVWLSCYFCFDAVSYA